ncbi:UNVERIFIED_CONTAM: hypothetical protein H355_004178 [Colinus virginianus]|nr:hypothetical protein H355_004178 [Colinus virginianus]
MQPSMVKYKYPQRERTVTVDATKALLSNLRSGQKLPSNTDATAQDLLDSILPPREWSQNGQMWTQRVSSTPATRVDVLAVEAELDRRLKQNGARDYGICSVREQLYSQCFDETLRQVAVACAERGLLLHRVRAELSTMIRAYQKLFESSAAFGLRKALQLEDRKNTVSHRLEGLRRKKEQLSQDVEMLQEYVIKIGKNSQENIEKEEHEHKMAFTLLRKKSQRVKHELERLLSVSSQK